MCGSGGSNDAAGYVLLTMVVRQGRRRTGLLSRMGTGWSGTIGASVMVPRVLTLDGVGGVAGVGW